MGIHDFNFLRGITFRNYFFKVIVVIFAILNSYKIIADDKMNFFYLLAFVTTGMSSWEIDNTVTKVNALKKKADNEHHDSRQ